MQGSRSTFEKKPLGYGSKNNVGEQGTRKKDGGGGVPHTNNKKGIVPKRNGTISRDSLIIEEAREGHVGK